MKLKQALSVTALTLGLVAVSPITVFADSTTTVTYVNQKESAAEGLTDQQKLIFKEAKKQIQEIAAGERSYGILQINVKDALNINVKDGKYDAKASDLSQYFEYKNFTDADFDSEGHASVDLTVAWQKWAEAKGYFDYYTTGGWQKLNHALWNECAYDMYWQDRTVQGMSSWPITVVKKADGTVGLDESSYIPVACAVTSTYASSTHTDDMFRRYYGTSGAPNWDIDTTKTKAAAKTTVKNAKAVVEQAKGLSDYEKLEYYRDYILKQVTYDNDAAQYIGKSVELTEPWQVNNVFDNDPSTNIVCEGYAKAFKFLCDMTEFKDSTLDVKIVSGECTITTDRTPQTENHMWNIVTFNGKNYIVDLTNSDEGTMGESGNLFMVPANKGSDGKYSISGLYYPSATGEEGGQRVSWSAQYSYRTKEGEGWRTEYKDYNDTFSEKSLTIAKELEDSFDDPDEAAAWLAQQMKARKKNIAFSYTGSEVGMKTDAFKEILERAYKHTGEAGLGDNLKRQVSISLPATANHVIMYKMEYFNDADLEKKLEPAAQKVLEELNLTGKSDYQKVKAIYDWICKNVDYDSNHDGTNLKRYSAAYAITNKSAVCEGYANLFYYLASEVGIENRIVVSADHAWNIVKLGDKYYNVDATWDAGRYTYRFFLKNDATYLDTNYYPYNDHHIRLSSDMCTDEEFKTAHPMSEENYGETKDGILYEENNGTITITGYNGEGGEITIPETLAGEPVATIKAKALSSDKLTKITFTKDVKTIESGAFGKNVILELAEECENLADYAKKNNIKYTGGPVEQAANRWVEELAIEDIFVGGTLNPTAKAEHGDVVFEYAKTAFGTFSEKAPTEVGKYYVRAVVEAAKEYKGLTSEAKAFEIKDPTVAIEEANTAKENAEKAKAEAEKAQKAAEEKLAAKENELKEAQNKVAKAEADLKQVQDNLTASESAKQAAQDELQKAQSELSLVTEAKEAAETKNTALQASVDKLNADLEKANAEIKNLKTQVEAAKDSADEAVKAELDKTKKDLEAAKKNAESLQTKLEEAEKAAEKAQSEYETALAAKEKELKDLQSEKDQAVKDAEAKLAEAQNASDAQKKAEAELALAQAEKEAVKAELSSVKTDLEATKAELDKTKALLEAAQTGDISKELAQQLEEANTKLEKATEAQEKAEEDLAAAESKLAEAEKTKKNLQTELDEANKKAEDAKKNADQAKAEADEKVQAAKEELAKKESELSTAKADAEAKAKQVDTLQAELDKATKEGKITQEELRKKTTELENTKKELQDAQVAESAAKAAKTEAEAKATAAETAQKAAEDKLAEANKKLETIANENADLKAQVENYSKLNDQLKEVQRQLDAAEKNLQDAEAKSELEKAQAEADKKALEAEKAALETEKTSLQRQIEAKDAQITKLNKDLEAAVAGQDVSAELRKELEQAKKDCEAANKAAEDTKKSLEDAKTNLANAQKENETLKAQVANLDATKAQLTEATQRAEAAEAAKAQSDKALEAAKAALTAAQTTGEKSAEEIAALTEQVNAKQAEVNAAKSEAEAAKAAQTAAETAKANAEAEAAKAVQAAKAAQDNLQKELDDTKAKLDEIQKALEDAKKENEDLKKQSEEGKTEKQKKASVMYQTHVQSIGWQQNVLDGTMAGTSGQSKRLEGIKIQLDTKADLGIKYTTHCQTYGWLDWVSDGKMSGTSGEAKRLEAIKIQLTGADKDKYNVYYRVHAQSYGWLGWAKNGEAAGTEGFAKRLEAIQIIVLPKDEELNEKLAGITSVKNQAFVTAKKAASNKAENASVTYRTSVQTYGTQAWKSNGQMAGTSGEAKRLEGIEIKLDNKQYTGNIEYQTHIQSIGWEKSWKKNGEFSGTTGQAKRLEAIRIRLTGEMADKYDIYYRVHAQTNGWLDWAKNGEEAGTSGFGRRLEGIEIKLVPKGEKAPGSTTKPFPKLQ